MACGMTWELVYKWRSKKYEVRYGIPKVRSSMGRAMIWEYATEIATKEK